MKTYYLVYVYKGVIKIRECKRAGRNFVPIDETCKYRYHTQIPDKPLLFQYGKIYCENKNHLPYCMTVIKRHYKDRVLQLERSLVYGKAVMNTGDKI